MSCVDFGKYSWFCVHRQKCLIHIFTVISFKCHICSQPAISEHYHCTYFSPFHSFRAAFSDAGSLWMLFFDIFLSRLRTQKCWDLYFFLGGILIFHMCISYLENNALYQVTYGLVPKLVFFLCQLIGSSYCNTAGYIHHFFSDLFIFGKENENVFIIIRFLP